MSTTPSWDGTSLGVASGQNPRTPQTTDEVLMSETPWQAARGVGVLGVLHEILCQSEDRRTGLCCVRVSEE